MNGVINWLQLGTLAVGIVVGLLAVFRGLYEMRESTRQRNADLRWKRANAARELVSDIHHDQRSAAAVLMMDWSEGGREHDQFVTALGYELVPKFLARYEPSHREDGARTNDPTSAKISTP